MKKRNNRRGIILSNNKKQRLSAPREDLFDTDDEEEDDDNDIILPTIPTLPLIEDTTPPSDPIRSSSSVPIRNSSSVPFRNSSSVPIRTSSTTSTTSVASSSTPLSNLTTGSRNQTPSSIGKNQIQNYDTLIDLSNRKQYGDPHVIYKSNLKMDCVVNLDIGKYICKVLPNCFPYHSKLEYPMCEVKCEDSINYDIDPIISVIVAMQLHVCARDCFQAENVYNRVINWLTTPGFFKGVNSDWENQSFMTKELSKSIDGDSTFRKILNRISENWKQKLRNKSGPVVRSLMNLKRREYEFPDQETGVILRKVSM
jgi:hypothetical protein